MPDGRDGVEKRHHSSHWGAFQAHVRDGRMVGFEPFAKDPAPSPILKSIQDAVYDESRVSQPMIRAGWLEGGPGKNTGGRGGEPFVPVSWDFALKAVADEVKRITTEHGNESIFAGSYGWASAGRFHHANTLVKRFFNCCGGFTDQVTTYSIAAGYVILPHVLGDNIACSGPITTWDSIAEEAGLFVMFGGVPIKNTQVASGGAGEHTLALWLERAIANGAKFVNISPLQDDAPDFLDAQWLAVRPNTDVALMLGLAHALWEENLHDRDFLARYCVGFDKFEAYLTGKNRRPTQERGLGGRDYGNRSGRHPKSRAAHGRHANHAQHELVAPARGSWRADVLDDHHARRHARANRPARRRVRLRLREHGRARDSARKYLNAQHEGREKPDGQLHPRRPHSGHDAPPGRGI